MVRDLTPEQQRLLRQLVADEVGRWEDNLYRARLQARSMSLDTPFSGNGLTLGQIITEYEQGRQRVQALLDQLNHPSKE